MEKRAEFSGGLFALSQVLILPALILKPSPFRWSFFLPILCITLYLVLCTTTGNLATDNPIGSTALTYLLIASDYILLTDVQRELRLKGQREPIRDAPLGQRTIWAVRLFASPRGVGWLHEPTALLRPRPTATSRLSFTLSQLSSIACHLVMFDVAGIFNRWRVSGGIATAPVALHPFVWRALGAASYGLPAMASIHIIYCLISIALVVCRASEPGEWPPLFGRLSDAWTVRRFWCRTWHLLLRRPLVSHSKIFTHKILGLTPGTPVARYVQLYAVFFISGCLHQGGERMMLNHWGGSSFAFFMLQAVAITFEEIIMHLAGRAGLGGSGRRLWRVVGYLWVWAWFAYSVDPVISTMMIKHADHFSIIQGLWSGEWFPIVV